MSISFYNTAPWRTVRQLVLERDGFRCTVTEPDDLGVDRRCPETIGLHVHDLSLSSPHSLDLADLATVCNHHHAAWHAMLRGARPWLNATVPRGGRGRRPPRR